MGEALQGGGNLGALKMPAANLKTLEMPAVGSSRVRGRRAPSPSGRAVSPSQSLGAAGVGRMQGEEVGQVHGLVLRRGRADQGGWGSWLTLAGCRWSCGCCWKMRWWTGPWGWVARARCCSRGEETAAVWACLVLH